MWKGCWLYQLIQNALSTDLRTKMKKKSVLFNFKECDPVILYMLVISRILFYFIVDQ